MCKRTCGDDRGASRQRAHNAGFGYANALLLHGFQQGLVLVLRTQHSSYSNAILRIKPASQLVSHLVSQILRLTPILSNSSMQQQPWSAITKAPASSAKSPLPLSLCSETVKPAVEVVLPHT